MGKCGWRNLYTHTYNHAIFFKKIAWILIFLCTRFICNSRKITWILIFHAQYSYLIFSIKYHGSLSLLCNFFKKMTWLAFYAQDSHAIFFKKTTWLLSFLCTRFKCDIFQENGMVTYLSMHNLPFCLHLHIQSFISATKLFISFLLFLRCAIDSSNKGFKIMTLVHLHLFDFSRIVIFKE